ncbi:WG repeat-containing protein [Terriglobus sp. 2YAB30_2]|uniref:WG repeat-containing protein n=1 Tax=unclassified Terriglobus TaxID=2628988 RepID=UPI003F94C36F
MLYPISEPMPGRNESSFGYIDKNGKTIVPCVYRLCGPFFEGKAAVLDAANRSGFINTHGEVVIAFEFNGLGRFQEGLCSTGGGYIDHSGKWVIDPRFLVASEFSEGVAFVSSDGANFGYIDPNGRSVTPQKFSLCKNFSEGLAAVCVDGLWGYVDRNGKPIIAPSFGGAYATAFRSGLAGVKIDEFWGFIDRSGNCVIAPAYEEVTMFSEGNACVKKSGKWGLIDEEGGNVVNWQFDDLRSLQRGIAPARLAGRAGFISAKGNWVVEPVFDRTYAYFGDLAIVRSGPTYSYVDRSGRTVWTSSPNARVPRPPSPSVV